MESSNIAVFGLGKSGEFVISALHRLGFQVWACDDKKDPATLNCPSMPIHPPYPTRHLIVSPGIPPYHPYLKTWKREGLKIMTDIELLAHLRPELHYIGVTGTMGKSTTACLLLEFMRQSGIKSALGGNFDKPSLHYADAPITHCILELSSFTLARLQNIHLDAALLTNLFPNHLDWHRGFRAYAQSKYKIFALNKGFSYLGLDFSEGLPNPYRARTICSNDPYCDIRVDRKARFVYLENGRNIHIPPSLLPTHAAYALSLGQHFAPEHILQNALKTFRAPPHRYEIYDLGHGIQAVNASKATTLAMAACVLAQQTLPTLWIGGGQKKDQDPSPIKRVTNIIHKAYYIGESATELAITFGNSFPYQIPGNLACAVHHAYNEARLMGGRVCIVLAPGYASWDQFKNFEERGKCFRSICRVLAQTSRDPI